MVLAQPNDYEEDNIELTANDLWKVNSIDFRLINLVVKPMKKLDQTSFKYQVAEIEALEGDLFRLTLPEALSDGYRWTTSAHSSTAA